MRYKVTRLHEQTDLRVIQCNSCNVVTLVTLFEI